MYGGNLKRSAEDQLDLYVGILTACLSERLLGNVVYMIEHSDPSRAFACRTLLILMRRANSECVCLTAPSKYVSLRQTPEHVCMYVCMYVSLKATKSAGFGGCQIPYQNHSKSDV